MNVPVIGRGATEGNGSVVENARKAAESAAHESMGPYLKWVTISFWIVNMIWVLSFALSRFG